MTKEVLKLALEALYALTAMNHTTQQMKSNAINAIKEALAQPEQELVAWEQFYPDIGKPQLTYPPQGIYYTPPQRTWVGLTNDEVNNFAAGCHLGKSVQGAIYEAEAKLKQKNNG